LGRVGRAPKILDFIQGSFGFGLVVGVRTITRRGKIGAIFA